MANRLAHETSPYLLQHAHNPVDWYPWGDEALARARKLDRPILLSIGYSACHWCHVMERESFEDEETAAIMNGLFVNVKVDREERPDLDAIYMKAVQAMTGQGGWPLTAILTPETVPFFGGTYFPPAPSHGLASFRQVLEATARAYQDRRDDVLRAAGQVQEILQRSGEIGSEPADGSVEPDPALLDAAYRFLAARFDPKDGGFGAAPKFPQPVVLDFLLGEYVRTGLEPALTMTLKTLRSMARGGLRDQLDGGFHRYSVDSGWLVPHFEKMLYDNALLARVYLHAWQISGDEELRRATVECIEYLTTDLLAPEGGFYSARDADSEGEEGLFYVWTPAEINRVLGPEDGAAFRRFYDVSEAGNFEGRNILNQPHDLDAVGQALEEDPEDLSARIDAGRAALLRARAERVAPHRDDKVLAGWTAMTIRTLAEVGGALGEVRWIEAAEAGARFLLDRMRVNGRLFHTFREGTARIPAFLEDHAALGNALLTLHEVTLDPAWLDHAQWTCEEILTRFVDPRGVPFDTAEDAEQLLVRPRETMDSATPSGTSLTAELLLRAAVVFGDERYRSVGEGVVRRESDNLRRFPSAFGRMLSVLGTQVTGPVEVAIVGPPDDPSTQSLLRTILQRYLPGRVVVGARGEPGGLGEGAPSPSPADPPRPAIPLLQGRGMVDSLPTAYVCRGYACQYPVTSSQALADQLP